MYKSLFSWRRHWPRAAYVGAFLLVVLAFLVEWFLLRQAFVTVLGTYDGRMSLYV
jgi:Na+-transporting methylmalonyl-CoA/oxaloacetate decarboxylase beta subunit